MIKNAVEFAAQIHQGAVRKGTPIPYITHPLETAIIVMMMTDDQDLIAAALLHDAIEDAGVTYEELKRRFGSRVANLVLEESEDKSRSWIERKRATVNRLKTAGREAKILALADKLSNIRSTARDYMLMGEEIWKRFNVKDKQLHAWYYIAMVEVLGDLRELPEYQEFLELCRLVFGDGYKIFMS